jgi:hypothetical protein
MATQALCQPACFHKKYNLGASNLFLPSILMDALDWT